MKIVPRLIAGLVILGLSCSAWAEPDFDLNHMKDMFNKYQRRQAYEYASQYLSQLEGDPYFDYYYGVSAIDAGFASQGVFSLERVLMQFPQDHVARLELARGYFILEEFARSRQEFEAVLATDPPDGVKRTAYLYLDRIRLEEARYRTTVSGFIELGAGYDSNVNSAPGDTFNGLLTPESTSQEDGFYNLSGSAQLAYPFAPGWKINIVGIGNLKKNRDFSQYDTTTGTVQTGISLKTKSSQYNLDLVAQAFLLDGESYRTLTGANAGWVYQNTEQSSFTTSLQFARLSYETYSILDSDLITLNLGYSKEFTASLAPVLFTTLKLGNENAKSDSAGAEANTSRDIYSLRAGVALSFSSRFILQVALGSQGSRYKGEQVTEPVGTKRRDTYNTADLSLFWLLNKDWRVDTRIAYSKNDSNVPLREYDRLLASINVNYNF
jgi:hypothetical protein